MRYLGILLLFASTFARPDIGLKLREKNLFSDIPDLNLGLNLPFESEVTTSFSWPSQFSTDHLTEFFKSYYSYNAPAIPILATKPMEHTNIIFIKVPRQKIIHTPMVEKTKVYLLVQNPDDAETEPPPVIREKPEVYFIKYSKKNSAQNNGSSNLNVEESSGVEVSKSKIDSSSLSGSESKTVQGKDIGYYY